MRSESITLKVSYFSFTLPIKITPCYAEVIPLNKIVGKRLIESLLEAKKWPKSIPKITDKGTAHLVAGALIQKAFFHRSEKVDDKKGCLKVFVPSCS
jgi:hypothetical protein